jgi:hypothetical protein
VLGNVLGECSATPGTLGAAEQRQAYYQPYSGQQKYLVAIHFRLFTLRYSFDVARWPFFSGQRGQTCLPKMSTGIPYKFA